MRKIGLVLVSMAGGCALFGAACRSTTKQTFDAGTPVDASVAASSVAPSPQPQPIANVASLSNVMASEASQRPKDTVTAEQLFAAMDAAGIRIDQKQQVLARAHLAAYCINARNAQGLYLLVCEYAAPDTLERGKGMSSRLLGTSPHYSQHVNGKTVLNVMRQRDSAAKDVEQVIGLFGKLSPKAP